MTNREALLVLHVAGVAAWLGANFTQLFLAPWFARRGGTDHIAWIEASAQLGRRYYNVAGGVIGVTGALLVIETPYEWSAGFVAVGITVIVVGAVLGIFAFTPLAGRQAAAVRADDVATARPLGTRIASLAVLDTVLVLTAVAAMVVKWRT
jgi:hypothetical protein